MSTLKIGWSEVNITPDKKISLAGQFAERISEYVEKPLSTEVDAILQGRQLQVLNLASGAKMIPITNDDKPESYSAQIVAPILADGEIIGGLILLSRESGIQMSDIDHKVAETTANIVGRQMEQ